MRLSRYTGLMIVAFAAAFTGCHRGSGQTNIAAQDIVEAFVSLQPSVDHKQFAEIIRGATVSNRFDVNQYFTVLNKLRPEKGYVLDWVYLDRGIGGLPVLYARETHARSFTNFNDYEAYATNVPPTEESAFSEQFQFGYIERLRIEDSPDGYFQLVVLRLLGDRFYMYWHEYYNETFLVCSKSAWDSLLQKEHGRKDSYDPPPPYFITAAEKFDFTPKILMGVKQAEVNVMTYNPFEGLALHSFVIARKFPHRILSHTKTKLLGHGQSFLF